MMMPKRRCLIVPAKWFRLMPGQPLHFWARVAKVVRERCVRKNDFVKVQGIARSLHTTQRKMK